jgi:hypothetical protein
MPADRLLVRMPLGDALRLFAGKRREKQLRETRLPRKRFGFVERQLEQMLLIMQAAPEFRQDVGFNASELTEELAARGEANVREFGASARWARESCGLRD